MNLPAIDISFQLPGVTHLIGLPGSGKTAHTNQRMEAFGFMHDVITPSTREPADFSGLPWLNPQTNEVELKPIGKWVKRAFEAHKMGKRYMLFCDEVSCAPPAVQAAMLKVIHELIIGDIDLPPNVNFAMASNPADQAANGWELAPPMANRMRHFDWKPDTSSWVNGMIGGWSNLSTPTILPPTWTNLIPQSNTLIASFIQVRPALLEVFPKEEASQGRAWPSRRTWEDAARCYAAAQSVGAGKEVMSELLSACVGTAAAIEFLAWQDELDLPNPEDLLKNPKSFKLPARGDQTFAVLSSVTSAVVQNCTPDRWNAAFEVLGAACEANVPDMAVVCAKTLIPIRPKASPVPSAIKHFKGMLALLQ